MAQNDYIFNKSGALKRYLELVSGMIQDSDFLTVMVAGGFHKETLQLFAPSVRKFLISVQ